MKCPECGLIDHSKVTDSRLYKNVVRRTRKCLDCNHAWKTYEINEDKYSYLESRDKTGRRSWTDTECKNLVRFKEQGLTYKEIGKQLGRTWASVRQQYKVLMDSGEYFDHLQELEKVV